MLSGVGTVLLGVLAGLRHAFEPDHLTAVSTLVAEARDARKGALLGVIWGLGHTVSLLVVALVLRAWGGEMPARLSAGVEGAVSAMLIVLGCRAILQALRDGQSGPSRAHPHRGVEHVHPNGGRHFHVLDRPVRWRPLLVGVVHGLAGSGALTALVLAHMHDDASRLAYVFLFGLGSIGGMAFASGLAGASLKAFASQASVRRRLTAATGVLAVLVGLGWAVPVFRTFAS